MENSSILKGFEFIDFNYVVFFFYEYYFFKKLINAFVSSFYWVFPSMWEFMQNFKFTYFLLWIIEFENYIGRQDNQKT